MLLEEDGHVARKYLRCRESGAATAVETLVELHAMLTLHVLDDALFPLAGKFAARFSALDRGLVALRIFVERRPIAYGVGH